MKRLTTLLAIGGLIGAAFLTKLSAQQATSAPTSSPASQPVDLAKLGKRDARIHDPSTIIKCGDEFWVYYTGNGLNSYHSKDLLHWERVPRVITEMPKWVTDVVPEQRGNYWAPDITYHNKQYLLYYAASRFGQRTNAPSASPPTSRSIPKPRTIFGTTKASSSKLPTTTTTTPSIPALSKGMPAPFGCRFGSYWSGIKLIQLDPLTGKRIAPDSPIHALAYNRSIEASAIYHHGDYYYLWVNWGTCCRGVNSTYDIRIGRSKEITGPYLDKTGTDMLKGGGTLFLDTTGAFIGPGHAGILADGDKYWFSCHYYDGTQNGASFLAIRPLRWGPDGWPFLEENPKP